MRTRIVIPLLVAGLLLAVTAWLLRPVPSHPALEHSVPQQAAPAQTALAQPPSSPKFGPAVAVAPAAPAKPDVTAPGMESPAQREQDYVQERVAQLMDLATDDQPASLQAILGELNNREPEIRQAAVQAAMQFGSQDAIPRLRDAMDQTDDLKEKTALAEAIEFLQTPSILEVKASRGAAPAPANARPAPFRPR